MSEMIERVAKAILEEQRKNRSGFPDNRDLARAAIEAMREPTKAMLDASYRRNDDNDSEEATLANYQDMIDEALK